MVGEFPELQGIIGGHLARAQGEPREVADAIRDHYKPVGQGDDVPTDPVTVAVSLADKLDTISAFFAVDEKPTGSKDPFALRRASLGAIALIEKNGLRLDLDVPYRATFLPARVTLRLDNSEVPNAQKAIERAYFDAVDAFAELQGNAARDVAEIMEERSKGLVDAKTVKEFGDARADEVRKEYRHSFSIFTDFLADRLKVQQREAGVRHDLIDAVFALGGEDDLVRLLARVKALQAFVETPEGADLLAGYKRAANILRKESHSSPERGGGTRSVTEGVLHGDSGARGDAPPSASPPPPRTGEDSDTVETIPFRSHNVPDVETALAAALDFAEPRAAAAIDAEDFEGAMTALATLRAPIDAFFEGVMVNDPDPAKRSARLALLARFRDAVTRVADFSRIEG